MNRSLRIRAIIVFVVIIASIYGLYPTFMASRVTDEMREEALTNPELQAKIDGWENKAIRRGLDLEGGMYIVLEIDQADLSPAQAQDAMDRVVEILRNRVDQFGVSEPDIKPLGTSRIIVQLPGLQDVERAKNLIGSTARLEFRLVKPDEDVMPVLQRLDDAFRVTAAVSEQIETEEAATDEDVAVAAEDTTTAMGADEVLNFAELPEQGATSSEIDPEDPFVKEHPFSSYLAFDANFTNYFGTPLLVDVRYMDKVKSMLESPEAQRALRDADIQFRMDPANLGQGAEAYPLFLLEKRAGLTGDRLTSARSKPDNDRPGTFLVSMNLDRKGARTFSKLTGENVGRHLAISLDGRVNSAPSLTEKIPNGQASISGGFTSVDASDLALLLRAGALPVDVRIEEERTVGPSLGADSIKQGVQAALYGMLIVIVFILIYYRLTGLIVVFALLSNLVILMAVLAQFGLVLTLPGIAGIILTIGMAVDANVLINERIREELRRNKTARAAVDSGYANATRTIVDANITTLIAAGILLWFGTGPILGFAVTLSIGILSSMFTALILTRVIMEMTTRNRANNGLSI
jgi:protein-export membrane protein SecD